MNKEVRLERFIKREGDREKVLLHVEEGPYKEALHTRKASLQAEGGADLDDFILLLSRLMQKTLSKGKGVTFLPDEGARILYDSEKGIDAPYITFKVISCMPKLELKPRVRSGIKEVLGDANKKEERLGQVYGQRFMAEVQFNVFAPSYISANETLKDFENLIFNYTFYFKKKGIAEILYKNRFTDQNYDVYRQRVSVRSVQYYIEIEKNYILYNHDMKGFNISVALKDTGKSL